MRYLFLISPPYSTLKPDDFLCHIGFKSNNFDHFYANVAYYLSLNEEMPLKNEVSELLMPKAISGFSSNPEKSEPS